MIYRNEFHAMGSAMLAVIDSIEAESPDDLKSVCLWFEELEQTLSRFRLDSELCQLNIHAGSEIKVSQILWDVFQESLEAEYLTNGLVTPLIHNALVYAGYDRSFDTLFDFQSRIVLPLQADTVSLNGIRTDADARSITLPRGARLDFGGI